MNKNKAFNLIEIIIIIVITAIISSIATGVIMINSPVMSSSYNDYTEDEDLEDFLEVYNTIVSKYYDEVDTKGMLKAAEEAMLNFLGDKYTTYLEDNEYTDILDELSSTYNGIGVSIENNVVKSVTSSSPAEEAGILVGDEIVQVNGVDVTNLSSELIGSLIKDDSVTIVNLVILRNGVELQFSIEKKELANSAVNTKIIDDTNIGYISIKNFAENLSSQVETALTSLESNGISSLIIDLRNNVGGYLTAAEDTASLFLAKGKTIYSLKSSTTTTTYEDKTSEKRTYPIVVLINGSSASASEILAAALKESYGATLVGTKSYGKGLVQQVTSLSGGGSIKTTTAKWYTPNGTCVDGVGIMPDYVIECEENTCENQVNKAVELLSANS